MYSVRNLAKYPFLRLLVPFSLGIGLREWVCDFPHWADHAALGVCVLALVTMGLIHYAGVRYNRRWVFGCVLLFAFVAVGVFRAGVQDRLVSHKWPGTQRMHRASLLEYPVVKNHRVQLRVRLSAVSDLGGKQWHSAQVLLYLPADSASLQLTLRDELLFYGRVSAPVNRGNPYEFDYARYLQRQGIAGVAYVDSGMWKPLKGQAKLRLKQRALLFRERILECYRHLGIEGDTFAVLSALTVGYKTELSEEVRAGYSQAGASHVLALSGLHIGILYALLVGFFSLLVPDTRFRWVKGMLSLLLLWSFAFVSGLSASVVRSVIMFSLLVVGHLLNRQRTGLNTVCIAAFGMLLWNPFYLFDVSFQLSFSAVVGILLGVPWLQRKIPLKCGPLHRLWELTLVSFAAQIATLPWVLFYFSGIPLYAIVLNIPIVLLATLIIWVALAVLLASLVPVLQTWLAPVLAFLVDLQNNLVLSVQHLPLPVLDHVDFRSVDVFFFLFLVFVGMLQALGWLRYRYLHWIAVLLLWGVWHVADYRHATLCPPHVVYYNTSQPLIQFVATKDTSYLLADTCMLDASSVRAVDNYVEALRLQWPMCIAEETDGKHLWARHGIVRFGDYTVCVVCDNRWKGCISSSPYPVDCLYLAHGFTGPAEELLHLFAPKQVVLHRSLGAYRSAILEKTCKKMGVECVCLQKDGALLVNI